MKHTIEELKRAHQAHISKAVPRKIEQIWEDLIRAVNSDDDALWVVFANDDPVEEVVKYYEERGFTFGSPTGNDDSYSLLMKWNFK